VSFVVILPAGLILLVLLVLALINPLFLGAIFAIAVLIGLCRFATRMGRREQEERRFRP
jgi:Flp pilus assembly protein TadB